MAIHLRAGIRAMTEPHEVLILCMSFSMRFAIWLPRQTMKNLDIPKNATSSSKRTWSVHGFLVGSRQRNTWGRRLHFFSTLCYTEYSNRVRMMYSSADDTVCSPSILRLPCAMRYHARSLLLFGEGTTVGMIWSMHDMVAMWWML